MDTNYHLHKMVDQVTKKNKWRTRIHQQLNVCSFQFLEYDLLPKIEEHRSCCERAFEHQPKWHQHCRNLTTMLLTKYDWKLFRVHQAVSLATPLQYLHAYAGQLVKSY